MPGGGAEGGGAPVPPPALVASVIDVGSNSALLLTLELAAGGRARQRDAALATTRLGSGLDAGGSIDPAARSRTRDAVVALGARARSRGASRVWAFATGAVRRAADGRDFAAELARAADCPVAVLSGEEEAALAYAAVQHAFAEQERALLVVDVGGATTELTLGRGAAIHGTTSLPLGALALTEARGDAAAEVSRVVQGDGLFAHTRAAGAALVASGGTATALAALDLGLQVYEPARVHGHTLTVARLAHIARQARADHLGVLAGVLDEGRARILPAGALVLEHVARAAGVSTLRVSEHGVRHAYLRQRLAAEGVDADLRALWS
jgi:exopolyphosphatase / guanosine-5'-triphosphate,3'-diphosphate pyrophosphatase